MHMVTTPGVEQHTFALDSTIPALKRVCVARTRACSASRSSGDMATSPLSAVEDAGAVSAEVSEALAEAGVEIRDYAALAHHLVDLAQREVCEPKILNPKP